jgi:putative transposase
VDVVKFLSWRTIRHGKIGVSFFTEEVWAEGKYRRIVEARSLLCYWAVRDLGVPMSSLGRKLGISTPAGSRSVTRSRRIAETNGFVLIET